MHRSKKSLRNPTNITLSVDIDAHAEDFGIDISQIRETSLKDVVNIEKRERWAAENAEFIAEYNQRIEAAGTLLQEWKTF